MAFVPLLFAFFPASVQDYPVFDPDLTPPSVTRARRERLKAQMPANSIALFLTNPERNRNNDCDFRFRPDSDFRYLTGFEEPDAALLIAPSGIEFEGRTVTELLFVNLSDAASETWLGYRMGPGNATRILGVQAATSNREFKQVLSAASSKSAWGVIAPPDPSGTVAKMLSDFGTWHGPDSKPSVSLRPALDAMRGVKDATELTFMRKAINASVLAHREAMKSVEPGMREYAIQAVVEYVFTREGCEFQGYNSIVGSGPNSCILHYEANRRLMNAGDMICMDVGAEYHGYSADVTRSFPVNGKFSPEQKAIYEVVLAAQSAGIAACKDGASFGDVQRDASKVMGEGLKRLGIIQDSKELGRYFMHGIGHPLGLDVHDSSPGPKLKPNVVLTVEPGIYIKSGSPCDKKWWNIGIRIEDDILVTKGDPENLSAGVPRTVAEIEALMKERGLGNVPIGTAKSAN